MDRSRLARLGLACSSLFLALSAALHIAMPDYAVSILSVANNIRVIGMILTILGALILCSQTFRERLVGLAILGSGLARAIAPDRMIQVNSWTNKLTHGILLSIGAGLLCTLAIQNRPRKK